MKKIFALLLACLMLFGACGPTTQEPSVTDAPVATDPSVTDPVVTEPIVTEPIETTPIETEPVETEPIETEPIETEPTVPVERFDHTIDVKEDTYVLNKDSNGDKSDANFSTETLIDLKSNKGSLTRYGFLKFDISSLKGDNDFTCIDLDITVTWKQFDAGNPELATIEVYGCDTECDLSTVTFNSQPIILDLICSNDK
ncbi:MAG: DNRLRE domain-containing protein, partial [Clostridia bacterium]|nr:DNRLRE domain-containing protein [Clostridia bacterium]